MRRENGIKHHHQSHGCRLAMVQLGGPTGVQWSNREWGERWRLDNKGIMYSVMLDGPIPQQMLEQLTSNELSQRR